MYTKQQVWNLLISYKVDIRSLVKICAVWAIHFKCEMIRIAFLCVIKSLVRDKLEPAAKIILHSIPGMAVQGFGKVVLEWYLVYYDVFWQEYQYFWKAG